MPLFVDEKTGVEVDADASGAITVKLPGKKTLALEPDVAASLSDQIRFAREYQNLYAPRPH